MTAKKSPCPLQNRTHPENAPAFLENLYQATGLRSASDLSRVADIDHGPISRWQKPGAKLSEGNLEKLFTFLAAFMTNSDDMAAQLAQWGWVLGVCEMEVLRDAWAVESASRFPKPPDSYVSRPKLEAPIGVLERHILLRGMPGSGRRMLLQAVIRWNGDWQQRFPAGMLLLDCHELASQNILHALEAELSADEEPQGLQPSYRKPALHLRRKIAAQNYLILLLNLEDRYTWETLQDIFTAHQRTRVIVTTSQAFNIQRQDDFQMLDLPGFTLDEGRQFFRNVLGDPAWGAEDEDSVRWIIYQLRGWPLALAMIAAWVRESAIPWQTLRAHLHEHLIHTPQNDVRGLLDVVVKNLPPDLTQGVLLFGLFSQPQGNWTVWAETVASAGIAHPRALRSQLASRQLVKKSVYAAAQAWEMHPVVHAYLRERVQEMAGYSAWGQAYRAALYAYEIQRKPPWKKQAIYDAWYRQEALLELAAGFLPEQPAHTLRLLLGNDLALMCFVTELPALRDLLAGLDSAHCPKEVTAVIAETRPRLDQFLADRDVRCAHAKFPLERGFAAAVLGRWDDVRAMLASLSPEEQMSARGQELCGMLALHADDSATAQDHFLAAGLAPDALSLNENPGYRFLAVWPQQRMVLLRQAFQSAGLGHGCRG